MKIVNEKFIPTKRDRLRDVVRSIAGDTKKAAFFDSEGDFKEFCRMARELGHKPKSRKISALGWKVWVI